MSLKEVLRNNAMSVNESPERVSYVLGLPDYDKLARRHGHLINGTRHMFRRLNAFCVEIALLD